MSTAHNSHDVRIQGKLGPSFDAPCAMQWWAIGDLDAGIQATAPAFEHETCNPLVARALHLRSITKVGGCFGH